MLKTKTKIRAAASLSRGIGAIRRLAGLTENVVTVRRRGLWWHLDLREAIDFTIYLFGAWEGSTARRYQKVIQPRMVALDIGANIGAHTLPLAQLVGPAGQVYSFEPTLYAFEKLQKNLSLNRDLASRIIAEQMMLTDSGDECEAEIYSSWPLVGGTRLHWKHMGQPKLTTGGRAQRLDDYAKTSNLKRVDFIKIDVDGFECHVLKGGIDTLREYRPVILMELAPYTLTERGRSLEELLDILQSLDYRLYHKGKPLLAGIRAMIPDGASLNVIGASYAGKSPIAA